MKNSYIVTFKETTDADIELPLIEAPIKRVNQGKIPFGEHSTGQSKEDLAARLELSGEIVSIFETINAVHIKMDSEEAHRLSLDERVLHVEQDMIVTATATQTNPGWGLDRLDELTASRQYLPLFSKWDR